MGDCAGALHPAPTGELTTESAPVETEPARNQANYRITEADWVGVGSLKQKCRANLAAIELLKRLEAESRPATDEEKLALVCYVGWSGLPQVFDAWNEDWKEERDHLEQLLTPDELDSARATTLNAHYTSPAIIRAMYALLQRLGFDHGRILEPACGLGHFIGLMPDEMHGGIRSVEHTIQHLEELAANLVQNITDTRKRLTDTQAQVEAPFEYAEKLASLVRRQQEIEDTLALTKGQAAAQLDARMTDEPVEGDAAANCLTETRTRGFDAPAGAICD